MTATTTTPVSSDRPQADAAFGRAVHMVMYDKRMTQAKVATALGIHQTALSKKLRGERPWSLSEMVAVADLLRVDLRDLLGHMWTSPGTPASGPRVAAPTNPCLSVVRPTIEAWSRPNSRRVATAA